MEPKKILIVEHCPSTRDYLTQLIELMGFQPHALKKKTDLFDDLRQQNPDVVLMGSCNDIDEVKNFAKIIPIVLFPEPGIPISVKLDFI